MIIEVTVNDNDFQLTLEKFLNDLPSLVYNTLLNSKEVLGFDDYDKAFIVMDELEKFRNTLNNYYRVKGKVSISAGEVTYIKKIIRRAFKLFTSDLEITTAEYLNKKFKVRIINHISLEDKNGEYTYGLITHGGMKPDFIFTK